MKIEILNLVEEEDTKQYTRYLCPDLHQCFKEEGICECGKKLEFIGMRNEKELNKYLGELQLAKFKQI